MGTIDLKNFHVIAVISNPLKYKSRYELFKTFEEDIKRKGGKLWVLEMATGARLHSISDSETLEHTQLWSSAIPGVLWHKENMINLAIQQLAVYEPNFRYVAWVDADVKFESGMLEETVHALQHWDFVQMFSHAIDFGPRNEMIGKPHLGFMYAYWNGIKIPGNNTYEGQGHPGFCWAARRESLNKVGNLIDFGVLGSADRHMACGLIGKINESVHGNTHPTYRKWLHVWQDRAERNIKRNVGYVDGTIRHMWHGRKANRGYSTRWQILVKWQFNPETDIKKDVSGLWQLVVETPRQWGLRDDIRRYFQFRNEDSLDV